MTMGDASTDGDEVAVQTSALIARHALEIRRSLSDNVLRIVSPDGRPGVTVTISAQGITLSIAGGDLPLQTSGALAIDAERVSLHGRSGVAIKLRFMTANPIRTKDGVRRFLALDLPVPLRHAA